MKRKVTDAMAKLAIEMEIGSGFTDYETIQVPLVENCREEDKPFRELKERWESASWGFEGEVKNLRIVTADVKEPTKTRRCDEFWDLWLYDEKALKSDFYARPFDENPEDLWFSSIYAIECHKGTVYSKDFAYFDCESCGRTICGQNPSNGWHVQGHMHDGWWECNRCYEERVLENGINDDFDGDTIPGQFFDTNEILEAGWQENELDLLAGSGYRGYRDPQYVIDKIQDLIDNGYKVLVNYESMAIGGLGGYVSIYTKPMEE
jgi:hypothetical protein